MKAVIEHRCSGWIVGRTRRTKGRYIFLSCLVCLALNLYSLKELAAQQTGPDATYEVNVASMNAADALNSLARQTGVTLLFPYDLARSRQANAVNGQYTLQQALDLMLHGTGLSGGLSDKGILTISLVQSKEHKQGGKTMQQNKNRRSKLTSFIAASIAAIFAGPAGIQNATAQTGEGGTGQRVLEEVVVTAEKRAASLQDVPIAVTAFTGDSMRDFGISNTQALQATTPGLVFNNTANSAQPFLRGVGTRLALNGLEPSIATYQDDRYLSRATASTIEFADVERVEILKGPQGTLYGRNATGGAIRVITKDVADELEGNFSASYGNFDAIKLSGTVSIPVTEDFGARLSALAKWRDGYADNIFPGGVSELDDEDYQAFRGKFRWDVTGNVTAGLTLNYWQRDDNLGNDITNLSPPGLSLLSVLGTTATADDEVATARTDKNKGEEFSGSLRFDIALEGVDLVSITTFTDLDNTFVTDGDGTSALFDVIGGDDFVNNVSQEIQVISNNDSNLQWIAGAYYFSEESDLDLIIDINGFVFSQGFQTVESDSWAIFGQATWDINDRWSLTAGGRYSDDEKEALIVASPDVGFTFGSGVMPFTQKDSWTEFTPKATLEYNLDDVMYYFTYARGYKSGGFNYPAVGGQPLKPEILDMFELGMKREFLANRLRLNAAVFYYDYKDLQVTRASQGAGATATTENAAEAEIWGIDMDFTWLVTDRLTLTGGFNYLDSEYTDFDAAARGFGGTPGTGTVGIDASGESLLRAPDFSLFASMVYEFTWGNATMPLVVTYSHKDSYLFDFVAEPDMAALRQDDYGLLTARLSYIPDGHWEVAVYGNNITDENYFDDVVANGSGLRASRGAPRTYGVELRYNF